MPLEKLHQIKKQDEEEGLIEIHHIMMKEYGYIPFEEWKKLPIPTVLELLEKIEEYHRKLERSMRRKK